MALYELAPVAKLRALVNAATGPLNGGLLYTYAANSSTPQATYTDSTGGTPNANPVVLDTYGYADVWLNAAQSYKFVLKDSAGNTIFTEDNIQGFTVKYNSLTTSPINILNAVYQRVVGSASQVTAGLANYSTIASAITAANAGDAMIILAGTYTESPTITKKLSIFGTGENTNINGTITFDTGSDYSLMKNLRTTQTVVLNSTTSGCIITDIFLASGKTFTDSSTGSLCQGMQEA